jgi:hypothetical protein
MLILATVDFAVCGSNRSFTTDQNPLMSTEPSAAMWR